MRISINATPGWHLPNPEAENLAREIFSLCKGKRVKTVETALSLAILEICKEAAIPEAGHSLSEK